MNFQLLKKNHRAILVNHLPADLIVNVVKLTVKQFVPVYLNM